MAEQRILIVGLGLIGGSLAEGLTKLGFQVGALTRSRSSVDYALQKGIICEGTTEPEAEFLGRWDLVIFSLYPHVFVEWIEKYQHLLKKGAVLTDVTGVKGRLVPKVQSLLREDLEFVPAHPMAGREVYGVQNADASIFRGANFIITPTGRNSEQAIGRIEELARMLGFRKVSRLSLEEHDEMIGFLSQLTHCIAVTLMDCKESAHMVDYTGDSFRDLTRIARINEDMWTELFLENREELLSQMELFANKFEELRQALESGNTEKMKEMMRLSTLRRSYFDKQQ
ncbi:MAG: prephenate dehydrogenase [Bacteroidales bacterium]|nr:prephenate dehydrogenase [Bacteroidales bacterium]